MSSRATGLLRLKHLREVTEARGEEMESERRRFATLADPGSAPRIVSSFNLFQTPDVLAARLASMFSRFGRILEPSAGLGRLYRAVRNVSIDCEITLVDNSPECARELYLATAGDPSTTLVQADFLSCNVERLGRFDSIIMNPPFHRGADILHIKHAAKLLLPGGKLVAICANGSRQRAALKPLGTEWIDLPAGAFRESHTSVATAIVVIDSPAG